MTATSSTGMRVATSCEAEEVFLELLVDEPTWKTVSTCTQWCAKCLNDIRSTSLRCRMLSSRARHGERCSIQEGGGGKGSFLNKFWPSRGRSVFYRVERLLGREDGLWERDGCWRDALSRMTIVAGDNGNAKGISEANLEANQA